MIKRIFAILLATCLLFALAACQEKDGSKETLPQELMDQIQPTEQKTEQQLAQEDDMKLAELCNAFMLALSDQAVYDETLLYVCYGNVSGYIDSAKESDCEEDRETLRAASGSIHEMYQFGSSSREKDGVVYYAAGHMKGVTITFQPQIIKDEQVGYVIKDGVVNKFVREDNVDYIEQTTSIVAEDRGSIQVMYMMGSEPDYDEHGIFGTFGTSQNDNRYYYNRIRAIIGDTIELNSNTYKNSEYTVFIMMPTTQSDGIRVFGQWNGTNLE